MSDKNLKVEMVNQVRHFTRVYENKLKQEIMEGKGENYNSCSNQELAHLKLFFVSDRARIGRVSKKWDRMVIGLVDPQKSLIGSVD